MTGEDAAGTEFEATRPGSRERMGHARWLTVVLSVAVMGLAACGSDHEDARDETTAASDATSSAPEVDDQSPPPEMHGGEPILIETRVKMFAGRVLDGSVIGDSPFCPGGTVRHEHGSPEIGFPAIGVFRCPDGQLKIGFGPGPDQMNNTVQTSDWKILDGSGRFAGISGDGQMIVRWPRVGASKGQETFMGMVVSP